MPDELDALRTASAGLLYPSDSDEPFDVVTLPTAASAKDALVAAGKWKGKVEEVPLESFFADLKGSDDADKFAKLKQAISSTLSDPKVFRTGQGEIAVYIVGKTQSGTWAALHTKSVET